VSTLGNPTPEQHEAFRLSRERDREILATLVDVHRCNRLNGGDRTVETVNLWVKLAKSEAGTVDALATLLAAAIDQLAELSLGGDR